MIYSVIGVVFGAVPFREISSNFGDVVQILEICTTVFKFAPRIFREKAMATVTAFIRVSTKRKDKANVRLRLRDGRAVQLLYVSDLTVNPDHWNPKKEEIKAKILMDPAERAEFNRTVALRKSQIMDLYNAASDKSVLTSDWLSSEMDKLLHPVIKSQDGSSSFFEDFVYFLETRKLSDVRTRNFRVVYRALQRFELYRRINVSKKFRLTFDAVTPDILREFETFLRKEHTFFTRDDETGKFTCSPKYKPVYDAFPETRTPQARGQNTINDVFTKLRTFFRWAVDQGKTENNPFKHFTVEECVYGTPYYITIEERNQLYKTDLDSTPALAIQRDIFVFQCLIGCRVGDLYKLTKSNIINGGVEYIPRKTKDGRPVTVRVPLNSIAKEILERYKDQPFDELLPLISQQKYNVAIKKMFLAAGLTRPVVVYNPTTSEQEIRPLNEVASSHLARRCFVGNLYKQVKDPNLVGALSGHKEGSRAFARYREIDEDMKRDLVSMLE